MGDVMMIRVIKIKQSTFTKRVRYTMCKQTEVIEDVDYNDRIMFDSFRNINGQHSTYWH